MSLVRFDPQSDIRIQTDKLTTSTWSGNTNNLTTQFTSSQQAGGVAGQLYPSSVTSSAWFYLDVYDKNPQLDGHNNFDATAEVQYAAAYGHKAGSGSPDFTNDTGSFGLNASRTIYSQYRQLVYGEENQNFTFGTHVSDHIYVINVNRSRYKHGLSPSTLSLHLSGGACHGDGGHTGHYAPCTNNGLLQLTDDSISSNGAAIQTNIGRQFNIVSGASGVHSGSSAKQIAGSGSYGLYYPDAGLIVLNADAFQTTMQTSTPAEKSLIVAQGANADSHVPLGAYTASGLHSEYSTRDHFNTQKIYEAIEGAGHFIVDSEEVITSQYYFARAKNFEFNYTNNPSFQDSTGNLTFQSMISNPKTFITTVGLYNDNSELLAVAKLSQPVAKDFTKESLFRIKLDF